MSTLRLWSWTLSPFAAKVRVAFAEKGIPLELVEVDPAHRPARLRELNPNGRVPVLELDGAALRESTVICEWLEETHPDPSLWPQDATERAVGRGLLRWVDDELTVNYFLSMRKAAFGVDSTDHPDAVTHLRERLVRRWPVAEELLGRREGTWLLGGENPTLADLAATPLAVRVGRWTPELAPDAERCPRTVAWLAALGERPSAAEVRRKGEPAS
jgi:glutathione S-transferase